MTAITNLEPQVVYEDAALLVLNKPAGLVVHPAPSHKGLTLIDWVRDYLGALAAADFEEFDRLGLVHRLDKETSGVIVVTKSARIKTEIGRQFHDRLVQKQYVAFIQGVPPRKMGIISAPIGRSLKVRSRMAVTGTGRPSETRFEVEENLKEVSLVNLFPKTGRTHQLRVHCAAIGHPIVGDRTYGASEKWLKVYGIARPLLHAFKLEITHPETAKAMSFEAPWPEDMKKAHTLFRRVAKAAMLLIVMGTFAEATTKSKSASSSSSGSAQATKTTTPSSSGSAAVKKEMSSLREQFKILIGEVSALQDRVSSIQANLDELSAGRRLRDLEKAISDMNGKTASTAAVSEETKTQVLDATRKLKAQQDMLDQMRDQIDRLQQALIQSKTRDEAASPGQ
jgi:23S rRNA pseudouridine1911/1915/1917 synthase